MSALGHFSQFCSFLKFFAVGQPTMMVDIFTQPPHHKKGSYVPLIILSPFQSALQKVITVY